MLSRGLLFVTLWTVASPAPLSIGFSQEEYWSRVPFPPPGDLLDPGASSTPWLLGLPHWQADFFTTEPPGKSFLIIYLNGHLWLVATILDSSAISIVLQLGFNPVRNMLAHSSASVHLLCH